MNPVRKNKMRKLLELMLAGGKVVVKDKHDNTVKESQIIAIYSDCTVTLSDTVHSDYSINDVTAVTTVSVKGRRIV